MTTIKKYTLSSGLPVYFCVDPKMHQVFCDLYVRFGGVHSSYGKKQNIPSGTAHFLEHYICETGPIGNLIHELGPIVQNCNAMTNYDFTCYYFHTTPRHFMDAFLKLKDNVFHPIFTEEKLEKTKPAILEEIRLSKDKLERKIDTIAYENLFKNYPFRSVLGTNEDIASMDKETIKRIYNDIYTPQNMILFLGGNLNISKTLAMLEKEIPCQKKNKVNYYFPKEEKEVNKSYEIRKDKVATTELYFYFKMPLLKKTETLSAQQISFYENLLFSMQLGNQSPLWKILHRKKLIIGYIDLSFYEVLDCQIVKLHVRTENTQACLKTILNYTQKEIIFDEEYFLNYKRSFLASYYGKKDYMENNYGTLINNVLYYHSKKEITPKDISKLRKEECLQLLKEQKEYFSYKHYTIIEVNPK